MDRIKKVPFASFFALFALAIAFTFVSCDRQEDLLTADSNLGDDTQLRIPDNWNGHVAFYLDGNVSASLDQLVGRQASIDGRTAVALVRTTAGEQGPQIELAHITDLVRAIETEYGEVAGYDLMPAVEGQKVHLLVETLTGPKGEASTPSYLESDDIVPACSGPCQEITSYTLTNVTGAAYSFDDCGNPAAAQHVVDQAIAVCFATEIGNLTIACEPTCECSNDVNTPMSLSKTCFANGGSFSSGSCTLTITGAITIDIDIILSKGKCEVKAKEVNPNGD